MIKNIKGFTLIELMVVIAIIGIITVGITQMNFGAVADKQKAEIYENRIKSTIETVRNYSLIGKGVGEDLVVPEKWKIDFMLGSDEIIAKYDVGNDDWKNLNEYMVRPESDFYKIDSIVCANINNTNNIDDTAPLEIEGKEVGSIIIEKQNLSLNCDGNTDYKKIIITSSYKNFKNTFTLNTVSGIIEKSE